MVSPIQWIFIGGPSLFNAMIWIQWERRHKVTPKLEIEHYLLQSLMRYPLDHPFSLWLYIHGGMYMLCGTKEWICKCKDPWSLKLKRGCFLCYKMKWYNWNYLYHKNIDIYSPPWTLWLFITTLLMEKSAFGPTRATDLTQRGYIRCVCSPVWGSRSTCTSIIEDLQICVLSWSYWLTMMVTYQVT